MRAISKKLLYAVMKYDRYDGVDLNIYLTSQNFRNTLYIYIYICLTKVDIITIIIYR